MAYTVQVGSGGYLGWKFLQRTEASQREIFNKSPDIAAARESFVKKMPNVKSADQLVSNYRLLTVALRAFGLEGDVNNRSFIKRVLEADPNDDKSVVNRLSDKRYLAINEAFSSLRNGTSIDGSQLNDISSKFEGMAFERNIGERHSEIEIALNAQRELATIAKSDSSEMTKWYKVLSSKPLRKLFEGAFGFGNAIGNLPIERQVDEMKKSLSKITGWSDIGRFAESENVDKVVSRYLIRSTADTGGYFNKYSAALSLLGG